MKKLFFVFNLLLISFLSFSQKSNYRVSLIGFYNLENLYDTVNNPMVDDEEFLPNSARQYNSHIYLDKLDRLSDVVSQMGTDITPDGLALLGVAEIENDTVLTDLARTPKLAKRKWKFVHYDSPDRRGVDVALFYNPKYFSVLHSEPIVCSIAGRIKRCVFYP
ncbi:MAG: hypothetical protein V9E88_17310 [Ferruginibacter sp.]